MRQILDKLKRGDLVAVAGNNCTYPAIFHKLTNVSLQYYTISEWRLKHWKESGVNSTYKNYINTFRNHYRIVKITEDSLTDEDLVIYKEMKEIYDAFSLQS
jgi:hypothetical protein